MILQFALDIGPDRHVIPMPVLDFAHVPARGDRVELSFLEGEFAELYGPNPVAIGFTVSGVTHTFLSANGRIRAEGVRVVLRADGSLGEDLMLWKIGGPIAGWIIKKLAESSDAGEAVQEGK